MVQSLSSGEALGCRRRKPNGSLVCARRTGLLLAGILILAACIAITFAKPTAAQPTSDFDYVEIVISDLPAIRQRFLAIMAGQNGATKIGTLPSGEVWRVPRRLLPQVSKDISAIGCSVMEISPDGTQIAYRKFGHADLTEQQRAAITKLSAIDPSAAAGALKLPPKPVLEYLFSRPDAIPVGEWEPAHKAGARLYLPSPAGGHVAIVRTRPLIHVEEGLTWVGEVENSGERAVLMLARSGELSGYFGNQGRIYRIDQDDAGIHTIAEIDPTRLPPDHAPSAADLIAARQQRTPVREPVIAPLPDEERVALEAKKITIDLMLLFTPAIVQRYLAKPAQWSVLAAATTNEVFRNSGLGNISVRVVHQEVVDYDESGAEHFDHLYRMVDGVGTFSKLHQLRNEKRADIVGLVLHSPSGCGQSTRVGADAHEAFFVVHHSCAVITYTIPHEIGHILGARHDRRFDSTEGSFPFAFGYVNGTKWRDVMSYQESCNGCPRIPLFSNPRVLYRGEPAGTAATDNARVILQQAERVSRFR